MVGTETVAYQRRPGVRVACLLIWINTLLQCSVARDLDSQIYMERMDWILRNTGHKVPTYRQIAGIALRRPVVQIPVFGLCLTI
jgi:hypothetical protein